MGKSIVFQILVISAMAGGCETFENPEKQIIGKKMGVFEESSSSASVSVGEMKSLEILKILFQKSYDRKTHEGYELKHLKHSKSYKLGPVKSGILWPDATGGIASRYKVKGLKNKVLYTLYQENDVYNISRGKLRTLSPAEKIDLVNSDFDYPTVRSEIDRTKVKKIIPSTPDYQPGYQIPSWLNLNRSVAAVLVSDLNFTDTSVSTETGLIVDFTREDLIGLSAWYFFYNNLPTRIVSSKCPYEIIRSRDAFLIAALQKDYFDLDGFHQGINELTSHRKCSKQLSAATFHLAIINEISVAKKYLVFEDLDHKFTVEGVVTGYKFDLSNTTSESFDVSLKVDLYDVSSTKNKTKTYKYRLFIDEKERIIGGSWLEGGAPDMVWRSEGKVEFNGYYSSIGAILGGQRKISR